MSEDKSFSVNLSGLGTLLASASGFLVAAGYLSLRVYLDRMEISGPPFLGAERYLLEAYLFAEGLFIVLPWAAVLVLILLTWRGIAPMSYRAMLLRVGAISTRTRPIVALAIVGIICWLLRQSFWGTGLWPGTPSPLPPALQPRRPELFQVALCVVLMWWFTVASAHRKSSEFAGLFGHVLPEDMAKMLTAAISLALALALPILYGRESRPDAVPLVQVVFQDKSTPSLCGLAVLHWSDGMLVWHAKSRQPRLVSLRLERVSYVAWGAKRSLMDALGVGYRLVEPVPTCNAELN